MHLDDLNNKFLQVESQLRMDGNKLKAQQLNEAYRVLTQKREDFEVYSLYAGAAERGQPELPGGARPAAGQDQGGQRARAAARQAAEGVLKDRGQLGEAAARAGQAFYFRTARSSARARCRTTPRSTKFCTSATRR